MSEQKIFQRHGQHLYFQHDDLDFMLQAIVGYGAYGGSTLGECLYAASQVDEKEPESWVDAWRAMAERVEKAVARALDNGDKIGARESFL